MDQAFSRRFVLAGAAGLAATVGATGCSFLSLDPTGEEGPQQSRGLDQREAPALTELVDKGELPALADRLPAEPMVVSPLTEPGSYGGELRMYMAGVGSHTMTGRTCSYDYLMRWAPDYSDIVPNAASEVEIEDGGRRYVIHLRPGMKWSDGEPFTSADIEFALKDILMNEELYPSVPTWLVPSGDLMVEIPDEATVVLNFSEPNGILQYQLARSQSQLLTRSPKHFLEEFHDSYGEDVAAMAKKEGFATWVELFGAKQDHSATPELPVITAWQATAAISGNRWVLNRNPYYWKTDPDGRQLPYIDSFSFAILDNPEVALLKAMQGEIDLSMSGLYINTLANKPQLAEASESGGYRLTELTASNMNVMTVALNLTHSDESLRKLFGNRDFRIGLSHAINRPELIKLAFQEQGEPWQCGPRPDSELYNEKLAKQYTEYDVATANEALDRAGLTERNSKGVRLHEGKAVSFTIDSASFQPYFVDLLDRIRTYWSEVGVEMRVNNIDRTLFYQRKEANQSEATVYVGEYGDTFGALLDPRWYLPFSGESNWAPEWAKWYTSRGRSGEEPTAPAKKQIDLYRTVTQTADRDEQLDLMRQILEIAQDEFWCIGIALPSDGYGLVAEALHNVPDALPDAYTYLPPGPTSPEQYHISSAR